MGDEIDELANDILSRIKEDIKSTTKDCIGEECKRIRAEYEDIEKKAKSTPKTEKEVDKWEALEKRLNDISEKLAAEKSLPEEKVVAEVEVEAPAPKKKGKKSVEEDAFEEINECPNCSFDKKKKPKYVGHCSDEGKSVKFSNYEKDDLEWEYCPNCGNEIEWEEENEDDEE